MYIEPKFEMATFPSATVILREVPIFMKAHPLLFILNRESE